MKEKLIISPPVNQESLIKKAKIHSNLWMYLEYVINSTTKITNSLVLAFCIQNVGIFNSAIGCWYRGNCVLVYSKIYRQLPYYRSHCTKSPIYSSSIALHAHGLMVKPTSHDDDDDDDKTFLSKKLWENLNLFPNLWCVHQAGRGWGTMTTVLDFLFTVWLIKVNKTRRLHTSPVNLAHSCKSTEEGPWCS